MSVDPLLGPMGMPLPTAARLGLADADAAARFEQVRWARRAAIVTPTGGLVRAVDLGHARDAVPFGPDYRPIYSCAVCARRWPCPSARMEQEAMA